MIKPPTYWGDGEHAEDPYKKAKNKKPVEKGWGTKHFIVFLHYIKDEMQKMPLGSRPHRLALGNNLMTKLTIKIQN